MKKILITGALLAGFSSVSMAQNPSFDYLDLGYSNWDFDRGSSVDGFELKGSKSLNDDWYIAGDYNRISNNGNTLSLSTFGFGYKNNFSDSSTFFAEADYAYLDPEFGSNENGYEVTLGIRSMLTSNFELKGAIEYLDIDNDDITSFVVGGVYNFTDSISTYLDYKIESDLNRGSIGVRYNF